MGKGRASKPTREQKCQLTLAGLIAKNWLVIKDTPTELIVVSKASGRNRRVKKARRDYSA